MCLFRSRRSSVCLGWLLVVFVAGPARGDIFRWDNGQLIPGTEGITPGPGVQLDHRSLAYADLRNVNLTGADFSFSNLTLADYRNAELTSANLTGANLTNTSLFDSYLANANLTGALVTGANFFGATSHGFTKEQLYSTTNYQAKNLRGIGLSANELSGWDLTGQNLTGANLVFATLTNTVLTDAVVNGAYFGHTTSRGFTKEQFYSTASYKNKDLSGVNFSRPLDDGGQSFYNDLTGWNLAGQNLTGAGFWHVILSATNLRGADLTGAFFASAGLGEADLTDALVKGAYFESPENYGLTKEQLYSTASYKTKDLAGISIRGYDLSEWTFAGQNLTRANFEGSALTNTDLRLADTRAASFLGTHGNVKTYNTISPDGTVILDLRGNEKLVAFPGVPIPVTMRSVFSVAPTGTFDLSDNAAVVLHYNGALQVEIIRERILSGRGGAGFGGKWTGTGITSSTAAAANQTQPDSRSLGYAENATLPLGAYSTFRGAPVDNTSVLIAFTRTGDANLDGVVNDDDVTIIGATYAPGVPNASWALGDFDYSGFVDDDDVTLLGAFYDPSAAPLAAPATAASAVAAVPEPGSLALLLVGGAAMLFLALRPRMSR